MTETANQAQESPKLIKKALGELGPQLPLGIVDSSGSCSRDISVRPWRMKEERELAQARDKLGRKANMASYVSTVLATMCTQIGHLNFESLKPAERMVHISQMFMGDVYAAYIWLRIQSIGDELVMQMECPHCGRKYNWTGDLKTIEVSGAESIKDAQWVYTMKHPIDIRGKKVSQVLLGPIRWSVIEEINPRGDMQTLRAKIAVIRGAVHGFPEQADKSGNVPPVMLGESDLDEMFKADIEGINATIDKNSVGPDLSIETECPGCKREHIEGIDWSYDGFFGISSQ